MEQNRITELLQTKGKAGFYKTFAAVMNLAWPAIIEQIMITAVQYVDTAMVGSLGADATAAVGLTASTTWLFGGIFSAAAVGFSVQVAQHLGADEQDVAKRVAAQSLRFVAVFGILIALVGVALSYPLPLWLGAEGAVARMAGQYFRIMAAGMPLTLGVTVISAVLRCAGDAKSPMILNTAMNVINMILNFFLIYPTRQFFLFGMEICLPGAGLGVVGAATASISATGIILLIFLTVLFCKNIPVKLSYKTDSRFDKITLLTAWKLGVPVALERGTRCIAQILITAIIADIGTVAVAANHLAVTAESLSYAPAYGVSAAATALVGQAMGAGRKDHAKQFAYLTTYISVVLMTLGGVLLFVFAEPLIRLFSSDPAVIREGAIVLRIVAFAEPLFGASINISGALRGAGDAKGPFIMSLVTMWGVRVTLSLAVASTLGLAGVWIAMAVELIARGILFLIRLYRGKWLDIKIFDA